MTISYNDEISSSKYFTFLQIICRWRGSIWKSVFREIIVWSLGYYFIFSIYHFVLPSDLQYSFSVFARNCNERLQFIPLDFMLGFFVTFVVDRWKNIFSSISFIEDPAYFVANYIRGSDKETRMLRRTIIRQLCLSQVLVLRDISVQVRKRFPTLESVVESGFLEAHERILLESSLKSGAKKYPLHWIPISWIFSQCYTARGQRKIEQDVLLNGIFQEIRDYRKKLHSLCSYDWVPVPLAYTQIVFLAVRVYFMIAVFARQAPLNNGRILESLEAYFPFMTILQVIVYLGWLKVAEALINPLGEDDDDFECNYIIDRNISIGMAIVENGHVKIPEIVPDRFNDDELDDGLLYTEEAIERPQHPLVGSAAQSHHETGGISERIPMVRRSQPISSSLQAIRTSTDWVSSNSKSANSKRSGNTAGNRNFRLSLHTNKNSNNKNNQISKDANATDSSSCRDPPTYMKYSWHENPEENN